jgi:hypothetical protein
MELSRLASLHKSLLAWQEIVPNLDDSSTKQTYLQKIAELRELISSLWRSQKIESSDELKLQSLARELDRMFDEYRLVG